MLQSEPQRFTEARLDRESVIASYSAPGKVFILGEYAVLGGLPSVIAAVGPRFTLDLLADDEGDSFHPQSPVARLLDWAGRLGAATTSVRFNDAQAAGSKAGGFGASTAQFALIYRALADHENWDTSWEKVWALYRELTRAQRGEGFPPSGADLVAQWSGGIRLFQMKGECAAITEDLSGPFDWSRVLVFSAGEQQGRKVATHEHLATLKDRTRFGELLSALEKPLTRGIAAIREGNVKTLGSALTEYADVLAQAGLEIPATREDRAVLSALPGVLGVKGAGALQADALVVAFGGTEKQRADLIGAAEARNLVLVGNGFSRETGVILEAGRW